MTTYEAWAFLHERYKNREFKSRPHYDDYIPKAIAVLGTALEIDGCSLEASDASSEKITPLDAWMFSVAGCYIVECIRMWDLMKRVFRADL